MKKSKTILEFIIGLLFSPTPPEMEIATVLNLVSEDFWTGGIFRFHIYAAKRN